MGYKKNVDLTSAPYDFRRGAYRQISYDQVPTAYRCYCAYVYGAVRAECFMFTFIHVYSNTLHIYIYMTFSTEVMINVKHNL